MELSLALVGTILGIVGTSLALFGLRNVYSLLQDTRDSLGVTITRSTRQVSESLLGREQADWHEVRALRYELMELRLALENASLERLEGSYEQRSIPESGIISELAHNIATPLSQVRIYLGRALAEPDFLTSERLALANHAVILSQEILDAYRTVEVIAAPRSRHERQESVSRLLESAVEIYAFHERKSINSQIDMPDQVGRYGSYYLLAILAPLIQNAVQASPPSGQIMVSYTEAEGELRIAIVNSIERPLTATEMSELNDTSKMWGSNLQTAEGGLGVNSARRLLSRVPAARLRYSQAHRKVTAILDLPR